MVCCPISRSLRSQKGSQKLKPADLQNLVIVPIAHDERGTLRLSYDKEQPIYFSCTQADRDALAIVPTWLSELVPIAFLDAEFLRILDSQENQKDLCGWLTKALKVHDFTIEQYCVDVLSKLYRTLEDNKLVEATVFLAQHAGPNSIGRVYRSPCRKVSDCC